MGNLKNKFEIKSLSNSWKSKPTLDIIEFGSLSLNPSFLTFGKHKGCQNMPNPNQSCQ
jgi:hypothetical protein